MQINYQQRSHALSLYPRFMLSSNCLINCTTRRDTGHCFNWTLRVSSKAGQLSICVLTLTMTPASISLRRFFLSGNPDHDCYHLLPFLSPKSVTFCHLENVDMSKVQVVQKDKMVCCLSSGKILIKQVEHSSPDLLRLIFFSICEHIRPEFCSARRTDILIIQFDHILVQISNSAKALIIRVIYDQSYITLIKVMILYHIVF